MTSSVQTQIDSKQPIGTNATETFVYNQGYITTAGMAQYLNKNGDTAGGTLNFNTALA